MEIIKFLYYFSNTHWMAIVTVGLTFVALIVAAIAMWYTIRNYYLKHGVKFRSTFTVIYTFKNSEPYVSEFFLENQKDRAVAIFKVYAILGKGVYLHLKSYDEQPLIIQPFGLHYERLDLNIWYERSMKRVSIRNNINFSNLNKIKLALSTSEGKVKVVSKLKRWDTDNERDKIVKGFNYNLFGFSVGDNMQYVANITFKDNTTKSWFVAENVMQDENKSRKVLSDNDVIDSESFRNFLLRYYENNQIGTNSVTDIDIVDVKKQITFSVNKREILDADDQYFLKRKIKEDERLKSIAGNKNRKWFNLFKRS